MGGPADVAHTASRGADSGVGGRVVVGDIDDEETGLGRVYEVESTHDARGETRTVEGSAPPSASLL
ncbi:hypothetical protein CG740_19205 [Streptomyces sp. CB01201]|nr:hypothetical protein CG740_19205 [Streptomyces sp. CB01201]